MIKKTLEFQKLFEKYFEKPPTNFTRALRKHFHETLSRSGINDLRGFEISHHWTLFIFFFFIKLQSRLWTLLSQWLKQTVVGTLKTKFLKKTLCTGWFRDSVFRLRWFGYFFRPSIKMFWSKGLIYNKRRIRFTT